jgi:hypothetical protein
MTCASCHCSGIPTSRASYAGGSSSIRAPSWESFTVSAPADLNDHSLRVVWPTLRFETENVYERHERDHERQCSEPRRPANRRTDPGGLRRDAWRGRPSAVFSAPVVSGVYTVIFASEVFARGSFGFGADEPESGVTGPGGGGGSHSRPVAAIVIGPNGVKVRPIVDATRIAVGVMARQLWLS